MGPTQLKAFRRYQVPVHAGATLSVLVAVARPFGWAISAPDLSRLRRKQVFQELTGRIDLSAQAAQSLFGRSIVISDLCIFRRRQVPAHAGVVAGQPSLGSSLPQFKWFEMSVGVHRTVTRSFAALAQIIGFGPCAPLNFNGWMTIPLCLSARRRCQVPAHAGVIHG